MLKKFIKFNVEPIKDKLNYYKKKKVKGII